jgi:hypothetical protein
VSSFAPHKGNKRQNSKRCLLISKRNTCEQRHTNSTRSRKTESIPKTPKCTEFYRLRHKRRPWAPPTYPFLAYEIVKELSVVTEPGRVGRRLSRGDPWGCQRKLAADRNFFETSICS